MNIPNWFIVGVITGIIVNELYNIPWNNDWPEVTLNEM